MRRSSLPTWSGSGVGRVIVDGNDIGEAEYEISVSQPRHLKEARGSIIADSGVIWAVYQSGKNAVLALEDGKTVSFLITRGEPARGRATIA